MRLLVVILKKTEMMNELLRELAQTGVKGATILTGMGMAEALINMEDLPLFSMLRRIMSEEDPEDSKVMLIALKDEIVSQVKQTIRSVVGSLDEPNTGVMFSVPIIEFEGLC